MSHEHVQILIKATNMKIRRTKAKDESMSREEFRQKEEPIFLWPETRHYAQTGAVLVVVSGGRVRKLKEFLPGSLCFPSEEYMVHLDNAACFLSLISSNYK